MQIWGNIVGIVTVVSMILFIGIWIWAWRKHHKKVFNKMAELPMEDDLEGSSTKNKNGDITNHE